MRKTRSGILLEDGPVVVTGAGGFVGRHLMAELAMGEGDVAVDLHRDYQAPAGVSKRVWNLPSPYPDDLGAARYVVHLAAISSVPGTVSDAARAWEVNLLGTLSVLSYVTGRCPGARMLFVSSSDVYGSSAERMTEDMPAAPCSPYGATKAAAEIAVLQEARSGGVDAVVTRTFPHFGPGQDGSFALPSFCRRILRARREGGTSIVTGNLEPERDYLYVTDVVRAYAGLLSRAAGGEVYNVCSGVGVTMRKMVETLVSLSGQELDLVPDGRLRRPVDVMHQVGSPDRIGKTTGWKPEVTLEEGLGNLLDWWEDRA